MKYNWCLICHVSLGPVLFPIVWYLINFQNWLIHRKIKALCRRANARKSLNGLSLQCQWEHEAELMGDRIMVRVKQPLQSSVFLQHTTQATIMNAQTRSFACLLALARCRGYNITSTSHTSSQRNSKEKKATIIALSPQKPQLGHTPRAS